MDYISAKERLSNPFKRWISENVKDLLVSGSFFIVAILLITNSIGGSY